MFTKKANRNSILTHEKQRRNQHTNSKINRKLINLCRIDCCNAQESSIGTRLANREPSRGRGGSLARRLPRQGHRRRSPFRRAGGGRSGGTSAHRWRCKTVAAEQVALEQVVVEQVATRDDRVGAGGGGAASGGSRGTGVRVRLCPVWLCPIWRRCAVPPVRSGPTSTNGTGWNRPKAGSLASP